MKDSLVTSYHVPAPPTDATARTKSQELMSTALQYLLGVLHASESVCPPTPEDSRTLKGGNEEEGAGEGEVLLDQHSQPRQVVETSTFHNEREGGINAVSNRTVAKDMWIHLHPPPSFLPTMMRRVSTEVQVCQAIIQLQLYCTRLVLQQQQERDK